MMSRIDATLLTGFGFGSCHLLYSNYYSPKAMFAEGQNQLRAALFGRIKNDDQQQQRDGVQLDCHQAGMKF